MNLSDLPSDIIFNITEYNCDNTNIHLVCNCFKQLFTPIHYKYSSETTDDEQYFGAYETKDSLINLHRLNCTFTIKVNNNEYKILTRYWIHRYNLKIPIDNSSYICEYYSPMLYIYKNNKIMKTHMSLYELKDKFFNHESYQKAELYNYEGHYMKLTLYKFIEQCLDSYTRKLLFIKNI
jgi:hypothetical protein